MLIVRFKQCESALAGERLDEAFEIVRRPDVRAHRRGQGLLGRVREALVERARKHLATGHFTPAAQDCQKAEQLGGNQPDVIQLRDALSHAMAEQRRIGQLRDQVLATARRQADLGQLTIGEQLIASASATDDRAAFLKREIAARRAAMQSALEKAAAAVKREDWDAAIDHLGKIDRTCRCEPGFRELFKQINDALVGQATDAIEDGRLDLAASLLSRLEKMPSQSAEAGSLRRALQQCREAIDRIGHADPAGADQILRSLASQWPRAKWLQAAASQVREVRETIEQLRTGPLGLGGLPADPAETATYPSPRRIEPPADIQPKLDFLLHVDGIGGFRVIDRAAVTLGPISASHPPDVALMADASLPTITITRSDEDYFVHCARPVLVNDKPVANKLLCHGDRIGLGPRVRITFRRPSVASGSAVLDLSGARLPSGDARHVVLLDRELIVGPGTSAHIRADELPEAAVVQRRGGQLICRAQGLTTELAPGVHVTLGPIGLAVG